MGNAFRIVTSKFRLQLKACILIPGAIFFLTTVSGQHGYRITYNINWSTQAPTKYILVFDDSMSFSFFKRVDERDPFAADSIYGNKVIHHATLYDRSTKTVFDEGNYPGIAEKELIYHSPTWNNWKFLDKKETIIHGYKCREATYKDKSSSVHVWYTTELPFPYGPAYCLELPGLVLKFKYINAHYQMTVDKIEKGNFRVVKPGDATYIRRTK